MDAIIVEDHGLTRADLRRILQETGEFKTITDIASTEAALCLACRLSDVTLIMIDHGLIAKKNADDFKRIKGRYTNAALVVVSGEPGLDNIEAYYHAGAKGFFPKTMGADAISHAIGLVIAGERYIPSFLFDDLEQRVGVAEDVATPDLGCFNMLTDRQREILKMVAKGAPNKVIARSLEVHEVTIKSHLRTIYRALGVARRTEAARLALLGGIESQPTLRAVPSLTANVPRRFSQSVRLLS